MEGEEGGLVFKGADSPSYLVPNNKLPPSKVGRGTFEYLFCMSGAKEEKKKGREGDESQHSRSFSWLGKPPLPCC